VGLFLFQILKDKINLLAFVVVGVEGKVAVRIFGNHPQFLPLGNEPRIGNVDLSREHHQKRSPVTTL